MSNLRQAAQQALEALETNNKAWKHLADSGDAGFWEAEEQPFYEISVKAITALRAALAEPDSDYERGFVDGMNLQTKGSVGKAVNRMAEPEQIGNARCPRCWEPITTPTPRKPLTDYINAAGINGADSPHMVVEKLQSAIERAHGIGEQHE